MNVYDFDGTIYYPNSTIDFTLFCMRRKPVLCFMFLPRLFIDAVLYKMGKLPSYLLMRHLFTILGKVDDFDVLIEKFWDKNERKISPWYLDQKKPNDLIISASPSCIIEPIARRLGVKFAATEFDRETGVFTNNLMYAKEKSRYMIDNDLPFIEHFYSDSLSDTPIALCAENAHFVTDKAQRVTNWPHLDPDTMKKVRKQIDTGWRIHI
ncbi:haloacid dehalogenase-like hydrolase [Butyrivibrio sp. JL13D10]|uniref:haloacid dehalogenase-like hydrolase n=1 Tax=Butyrivibrio sp. JL13D10 TaxID=3236815 RepID=UPI0038B5EC3D